VVKHQRFSLASSHSHFPSQSLSQLVIFLPPVVSIHNPNSTLSHNFSHSRLIPASYSTRLPLLSFLLCCTPTYHCVSISRYLSHDHVVTLFASERGHDGRLHGLPSASWTTCDAKRFRVVQAKQNDGLRDEIRASCCKLSPHRTDDLVSLDLALRRTCDQSKPNRARG